jgi:small subunit ribosomal protein S21
VAEVIIQESESLENALRRFKRKVQQEDIIKEIKKHSFYMKPGEKRRAKATAQEAASGIGLSWWGGPECKGRPSVFHAAERSTSENQAPVRQSVWDRLAASCPQAQGIRARRPRILVSSSI